MIGGTGTVTRRSVPLDRPGRPALHRTSFLELAPLPTAVPCARLHALHILHEWGLRHLADDATLIVSELMTNAADASVLLPDRPPIALRLLAARRPSSLRRGTTAHWTWNPARRTPTPSAGAG